jgi:hypothetical protein
MSLLYEWLEDAVRGQTAAGGSGHAIVYHDTYLSWRGLLHRVERRARELAGMGIVAGDWVGLMLGNDPELVVLTLALSKLEAVTVPLDPTTGGRDLDMALEAVPLRAIVTRPNAVDPLAAPSGTLRMNGATPTPRITAESRHRISGTLLTCSLYPWTRPRPDEDDAPEAIPRGSSEARAICVASRRRCMPASISAPAPRCWLPPLSSTARGSTWAYSPRSPAAARCSSTTAPPVPGWPKSSPTRRSTCTPGLHAISPRWPG